MKDGTRRAEECRIRKARTRFTYDVKGEAVLGASVERLAGGSSAVLREAAIRFLQYYVGPEGRSKQNEPEPTAAQAAGGDFTWKA